MRLDSPMCITTAQQPRPHQLPQRGLEMSNPAFLQGSNTQATQLRGLHSASEDPIGALGQVKTQKFQAEFILEIVDAFKKNRSSSRATVRFSWGNITVQRQENFSGCKVIMGGNYS